MKTQYPGRCDGPDDGDRCRHGAKIRNPCNACDEYMRGRAEALAEAVAKAESYAREHLNYDDDQILSQGVPDALRELK